MRMGRNSEDFLGENTKEQGRIKKKKKRKKKRRLMLIIFFRKRGMITVIF